MMEYPLIDRQLLADLRLAHGTLNFVVLLFFAYQARLGLRIRGARLAKAPMPFAAIKRHRRSGPILAGLAVFGYLSGLVLVMLHTGDILEYPAHFVTGTLLVLALSAAVLLSRKIKGQVSPYRAYHAAAAAALLVLYLLQCLLGLGVLF
jgi:hypothetical protein